MRTALSFFLAASLAAPVMAEEAKVVLIAGRPSHGPGDHEFNAGTLLLEKCLKEVSGVKPVVVKGGWPEDEKVLEGAKTVVFYMDGGNGHPMIQKDRLQTMKKLMDQGVGLVCIHYAVEFPVEFPVKSGKRIADDILEWLGGYYETGYSKNPHNHVEVTPGAKDHPITRGLKPYSANDEWYFRIRFRPDDKRVMPILTAMLPKDKPNRETLAWATERKDGGRSFGFTGAHVHKNWGIPEFRRMVLNAILWTAKVEVPPEGVQSVVTTEDLEKNLDPKGERKQRKKS